MPYTEATLPDWVKKKFSPKLQRAWMDIFNSVMKQYNDETKAFKIANDKIKNVRESGYFVKCRNIEE